MTVVAAVASREHHSAEDARNAALSRLVALRATSFESSDPALAMQLALVAYRLSQTTAARSALLDATAGEMPTRLIGRPGQTALALGDDGHRVAIAYQADDRVALYALRYAQLTPLATVPGAPRSARVDAIALSDSGELLATGSSAGVVTLWSLSTPAHPEQLAVLHAGRGAVRGLSFSPAGGSLAAADADGSVQRWSLTDPRAPALAAALVAPGRPLLEAVSYSHDGTTLAAAGSHGSLVVWPAHGGTAPLAGDSLGAATLTAVTYSPDGHTIAVGAANGSVWLWALGAGDRPSPEGSPVPLSAGAGINALAFSRDGRYLAAGTDSKAAPVWATSGGAPVATLPHPANVTAVSFTDGDRRLISTDAAGTTMIWQFPAPSTYTFSSAVTGVSYSTTRPQLAVTLQTGQTDAWSVVDEWHAAPEGAWYASPPSAAPAHPYWARTTSSTSTTTSGPAPLVVSPHAGDEALSRTRAAADVVSSALSANGQLFAAAGSDRLVWLWDVSDPASPQLLARLSGFTSAATAVVFSGNSQTLFAASADHTVRIWTVAKPSHPKELPSSPLTGPSTAITKLALSPDNHTLAVATIDGHVWLWSVANPSRASLDATLAAARDRLTALAFSPSDNVLVAGGTNRRLTFWHYRPYEAVNRICGLGGTAITANEWALYVPGAPYNPPCANWTPPHTSLSAKP
jgi:WD40 repeat protein